MKEMVSAIRSRKAKRLGLAVAIALTGTLVSGSATHAAAGSPSAAKSGGEVIVGIGDTFPGFCVANIPNHSALGGFRLIYEQLFERTAAGTYVGSLAESGTPNATFTQWVIKLRPNIKFSNGEAFDAAAVKLNIELNSGLYSVLNPTANANFAKPGYGYASTGYAINANIVSLDKVDDLTVNINLDRPQADFLGTMYRAGRYVMRAPAQLLDPTTCVKNPIGTGPFVLESYTNDQLIVNKNPTYWRKDPRNGKQLPYLNKVTFINIKEPSMRAAAVRTGTIDAAQFATGDATFVKDLQKRKSVVTEYKSQMVWWGQWVPNVLKAGSIFKYKNCRLGFAYAVDWNTYNKVRFKGLGLVSGSIVGKGHPMFSTVNGAAYKPALAKTYVTSCKADLAAANMDASAPVTLYADQSSQSLNNVKMVQTYMEAAGFKMNAIYQAEAATLIGMIYGGPASKFDITEGTPAEGADSAYVMPFFLSKAFPTGAKSAVAQTATGKYYNTILALGNHGDTKVDDMLYAAQAEPNAKKAALLWKAATEYQQAEGYLVPTIHTGFNFFVNKKAKLNGIGTMPVSGKQFAVTMTNKGVDWSGIWKG